MCSFWFCCLFIVQDQMRSLGLPTTAISSSIGENYFDLGTCNTTYTAESWKQKCYWNHSQGGVRLLVEVSYFLCIFNVCLSWGTRSIVLPKSSTGVEKTKISFCSLEVCFLPMCVSCFNQGFHLSEKQDKSTRTYKQIMDVPTVAATCFKAAFEFQKCLHTGKVLAQTRNN